MVNVVCCDYGVLVGLRAPGRSESEFDGRLTLPSCVTFPAFSPHQQQLQRNPPILKHIPFLGSWLLLDGIATVNSWPGNSSCLPLFRVRFRRCLSG